jgi:hypothetical protein
MALTKGVNAYLTVSTAGLILDNILDNDAWTSAATPVKENAIITATALLDDLEWNGSAVTDSQQLAFPRNIEYFETRLGSTTYIDNDTPARVERATAFLALHLLNNPGIMTDSDEVLGLSVAGISLGDVRKVSRIPRRILEIVSPLLKGKGSRYWWRAN